LDDDNDDADNNDNGLGLDVCISSVDDNNDDADDEDAVVVDRDHDAMMMVGV
jgi:hypothetical protein